MSVKTIISTNQVAQHYRGEFRFYNLNSLKSDSVRTRPFCPMPNINIKFCFEVHYKYSNLSCGYYSSGHDIMLLKLKLMTLCASGLPPSMKLKLNVGLYYTDGSVLHQYKLLPALTTDQMKSVVFDDVLNNQKNRDDEIVKKISKEHSFIVQCHMEFFDHIHAIPNYYKELSFTKHLKNFAANLGSLEFGESSDITINIDDESFPAHKAVLIGHSPVFKNMLAHNFKESITNTITITDSTAEIFETFLHYMYTGEIEDKSWTTAKELYVLADKYDVSSLKQLLAEIIISKMSLERICDIIILAFDYNDDKIKKEAVGFAATHIRELMSTTKWKEVVDKHPRAGYEAAISYVL